MPRMNANGDLHVIYDRHLIDQSDDADVKDFTFFTDAAANKFAGNLNKAGEIDAGLRFDVYQVRFGFLAALGAGNAVNLLRDLLDGILTMTVGDIEVLQGPGWLFPMGGGLVATGTRFDHDGDADNICYINGSVDPRAVFTCDPPIVIRPNESFRVDYNCAADITFTADLPLYCVLAGRLYAA